MTLEEWRLSQGLTNTRLAELLHVDKSTTSRIRRRVTSPTPETAKKILALTNGAVTLGDLYGGRKRDDR